jgi:hypothetical protein
MELTDLESDILTWLREATRGRANFPTAAAPYLAGNERVDTDNFAAAVDPLEAFGLVTSIRAWGGHVYRLSLTQQALVAGRESHMGIALQNITFNTMIASPGGQQAAHQDANVAGHGQVIGEQAGTHTLPDRDTGTDATTAQD